MFSTRDVWMVIKKATLTVAEDDRGVEHRMAEVALVLDPLPMPLARDGHRATFRRGERGRP